LNIALFFLLTCINALASKFVVFSLPMAPGVATYYIVVACMILFVFWFGVWGALSAYAGCFIGAGLLSGIPPEVAWYWSLADLWQAVIPVLVFWYLKRDPYVFSRKNLLLLLISGCILNNLAGAVWGSLTLALGGQIPWDLVFFTGISWWLTNIIVCIIILPPALYLITPYLKTHELFVNHDWT